MRVLVINPMFTRYGMLGACEQDCLATIRNLKELGHEVRLLTMNNSFNSLDEGKTFYADQGVTVELVAYEQHKLDWRRLRDPAFLDGASWECAQQHMTAAMEEMLDRWQPEFVWSRTTFSWALARLARRRGIPTVIRSVNYEPDHEYLEEGNWLANQIRYYGKVLSERRCLQHSDVLVAITPDEQHIYQRLARGATIDLLPLHSLPRLLRPPHRVLDQKPLRVFCMGSSYNVPHNLAALEFVVEEIVPLARQNTPDVFEFHVMGGKVPPHVTRHAAPDLVFDGFVPNIDAHLQTMDIALVPSLYGQGMQQKIFEPLCRGFPTLTNRRALAGYPYQHDESVLVAETAEDYVRQLCRLQDPALRAKLAEDASRQSHHLFSAERIETLFLNIVQTAQAASLRR